MPMLGAGDGSAKDSALSMLDAAAQGGGAAPGLNVSPYRIPVRTGGVSQTEGRRTVGGRSKDLDGLNAGQYSGDTSKTPEVNKFTLDDNGVQAAIGAWYGFTDDYRQNMMKRMWFLGLIKTPTDFDGATAVWKQAVGHAANFAAQGREIDPQDVLGMLADGNGNANGRGGYKTSMHVSRSIDLTNPTTAKEWVQEAFHQSMGRKADDAEVRAMADALLAEAKRNPSVSTTTSVNQFDDQGNPVGDTNTVTSGGFNQTDAQAFLQHKMDSNPEAGAHQAAADLFPALLQALGSGV